MGLLASKAVEKSLNASPEFGSACAAVYDECLSLSGHAFPGVKPYQLFSAAEKLHRLLHPKIPVISRWVPRSPDRNQVDQALKKTVPAAGGEISLNDAEFRKFATELFVDAVVYGAGQVITRLVPLGAAVIGGIGNVIKPGRLVVPAAIGGYAMGVVISVYLGLH